MNQLRELIKAELLLILPRVFFNRVPDSAVFPFITFSFTTSFMNGEVEIVPIDVDVWDRTCDTTILEGIASDISGSLHRNHMLGDGITVSIYREGRSSPDDDDPQIKRRRISFQARCLDNAQIRR